MIRYFIFSFVLTSSLLGLFFYSNYQNAIESSRIKQNHQILYDYQLATKLSNEKLKNIFLEFFNTYTFSKILYESNKKTNKQLDTLLKSLVLTHFYNNKILNNIIFYNDKGVQLFSIKKIPPKEYPIEYFKNIVANDKIIFEINSTKQYQYAKIYPIYFQGQTVGYIKFTVSFDKFIHSFLSKYQENIRIVKKILHAKNIFTLSILSSENKSYLLEFKLINSELDDKFQKFLFRLILSILLLLLLFYTLYSKVKTEKNLRDKIKWQKEFFRKIIYKSPNPIFVKNKNFEYIIANNATAHLFGLESKENLIGKTNLELPIDKKLGEILQNDEEETIRLQTTFYRQIQKINDKYFKIILIPINNLEYPLKEQIILGFATNITSEILKKNELANNNIKLKLDIIEEIQNKLKLQKEKKGQQILLSNIFKSAKSGIAVIDQDGRLVKYNKSFYKTLDYNRQEFLKKDFYSLFPEEDISNIIEENNQLFTTKKAISNEYIILTKANQQKNCIGSSTLIRDEYGKKLRLFICEDITKLKELEIEQTQNNKIIAQQAKMAEMGEMIGSIAHQWRQPLNAINAAAMKLNFSSHLNTLSNEEVQEKTKFIEQQSIKMSETITDFMNFFKPSTKKEYFDIVTIYKKILEFLEPQLTTQNIKLEIINDKNIQIYGFKNEFEHILLNLINNAKDAFKTSNCDNKHISVVVKEEKKNTVIKVIDSAGGIPSSILNKIFNPYFTTKEQGEGIGIGLYMTKIIIEKHFKGSISATNDDDGAVFTLNFPKEKE